MDALYDAAILPELASITNFLILFRHRVIYYDTRMLEKIRKDRLWYLLYTKFQYAL